MIEEHNYGICDTCHVHKVHVVFMNGIKIYECSACALDKFIEKKKLADAIASSPNPSSRKL